MTTFFVKVRLHDGSTKTCFIQVPITDGESASTIEENVLYEIKNELYVHLRDFQLESIQFVHKSKIKK